MCNRLYILIITLLISIAAIGGPRYESFMSDGHQVIFFYPKVLKSSQGQKKFEYDFTHQQATDSVTFNFSIISKEKPNVTKINITGGDDTSLSPNYFKTLYCEYLKGWYTTRVQTSFNYETFKQLFLNSKRMIFRVTVNDQDEEFEYKSSQWRKEQETMSIILNLFD